MPLPFPLPVSLPIPLSVALPFSILLPVSFPIPLSVPLLLPLPLPVSIPISLPIPLSTSLPTPSSLSVSLPTTFLSSPFMVRHILIQFHFHASRRRWRLFVEDESLVGEERRWRGRHRRDGVTAERDGNRRIVFLGNGGIEFGRKWDLRGIVDDDTAFTQSLSC